MSDTPKRKFKCNMIDHQADPEMSFRELDALVKQRYFTDLDGYESCIICVFYGDEGNHDYRIEACSDDPDALYATLRHNLAMNMWLHGDINLDMVADYKDDLESAAYVQEVLDQLYDTPCGDHAELRKLSNLLSHSYSMFLVDAASTAFSRGIKSQLTWFKEVNAFEDNSNFADRPLQTITPTQIRDLLLQSRDQRKSELKQAQHIDVNYYRALEKADHFMDDCLETFQQGVEAYGDERIHYVHLGAFASLLKDIDDTFPLEFIETLSNASTDTVKPGTPTRSPKP